MHEIHPLSLDAIDSTFNTGSATRILFAWDDALLRNGWPQDILEQRLSARKVCASCSRCGMECEAIATYAQRAFEVRVARSYAGEGNVLTATRATRFDTTTYQAAAWTPLRSWFQP